MVDRGVVEDELIIDWDHLLENLPDELNFDFGDQPPADGLSTSPDSGCSLSIDDIEQYLMNDESYHREEKDILAGGFFSDVILDSLPGSESDRPPKASSTSPESVEVETDEEEKEQDEPHQHGADVPQTKENRVADVLDDDDDNDNDNDNDPDAKKRKRYCFELE